MRWLFSVNEEGSSVLPQPAFLSTGIMERTDYDATFGCPVCLCPSQSVVFGLCQHYICSACLYDPVDHLLKPTLRSCPICKAKNVFPEYRPDIPDVTKQLMTIVGVVKCERKRCGEEMWSWEVPQHERTCRGLSRRAQKKAAAATSPDGTSGHQEETRRSKRKRIKSEGRVPAH